MSLASSAERPSRPVITASIALLILVWSINFVAGKIGLQTLPPLAMSTFRVVLAGIVMVPTYLFCARLPAFAEATQARKDGLTGKDLWTFFYLGFFGVSINQLCFTIGLSLTSVSHSALIVGMIPIYTLVLAVVFRLEAATWRRATGMFLAFAGIAILAMEKGAASSRAESLVGDTLTFIGSFGFAIYVVLGKRVAARYDTLTMTAFNHFAGALLALPLAVYEIRVLHAVGNLLNQSWKAWAAVAYMALFSSALAYVFYFWLLRYLEASQLSAFTYLLPVVATLIGFFWLGEKVFWGQALGGVLALGGVWWIQSGRPAAVAMSASR